MNVNCQPRGEIGHHCLVAYNFRSIHQKTIIFGRAIDDTCLQNLKKIHKFSLINNFSKRQHTVIVERKRKESASVKNFIFSFVEYLSKLVTNDQLNCVVKSLREQTISYGINQILFHLTEVRYQPKFMKMSEFVKTCISNSFTKYHFFLMYRTKVIRKRTMVTDFPAQLTVYIHPKTLRFLALFWMGRVLHIC